jgi:hypothetical protein
VLRDLGLGLSEVCGWWFSFLAEADFRPRCAGMPEGVPDTSLFFQTPHYRSKESPFQLGYPVIQ